jgi:hypothetical protein
MVMDMQHGNEHALSYEALNIKFRDDADIGNKYQVLVIYSAKSMCDT